MANWTEDQLIDASHILNGTGVRLMRIDSALVIGIWSDLDRLVIRWALNVLGFGDRPIRYLDGPDGPVPVHYKVRRIEGDPVPLSVLAEMERHPETPWKIRDALLKEMGYHPSPVPWAANDPAPCTVVPVELQRGDEREGFLARQRRIARAWALWLRWRAKYPEQADRYRQMDQDESGSDLCWLLDFVSSAEPRDRDPRNGQGGANARIA